MSEFIKGENFLLTKYVALLDAYVVIGCDKECSLSVKTDTIEKSGKGSGVWREYEPIANSWSGSSSGLTSLNNTNMLSLAELRELQYTHEKLTILFARTGENSTVYNSAGEAIITSSTDNGPYDNISTYSIEFQGTGPLTDTFTPAQIIGNVKRFEYTGIAGETTFINVKDVLTGSTINLINKTLLGVEVDGVGYSKMITTGTPVDKEFKFTVSTGQIEVPIGIATGIEVFGYYRD